MEAVVTDTGHNLARNLRALCERERSIAEVCREIGINRQQFNKYLSGTTFPSRFTMRRVCQYFRISETDILRSADEFSSLFVNANAESPRPPSHFTALLGLEREDSADRLRRYRGYYQTYYMTPISPGMIVRSPSSVYERSGAFFARGLERFHSEGGAKGRTIVSKYHGQVAHIGDRIYVFYVTKNAHCNLSLVILYPCHRPSIDLLTGVFSGVSSGPVRQPFAGRIVFEYLGTDPDLRTAIGDAGLFPFDSPNIRPDIRKRLRLDPAAGDQVLLPAAF